MRFRRANAALVASKPSAHSQRADGVSSDNLRWKARQSLCICLRFVVDLLPRSGPLLYQPFLTARLKLRLALVAPLAQ